MGFELSYAGVSLVVPNQQARAWVDAQLGDLQLPGPLGFPASKLAGLISFASPPLWRPHVNSLYWPAGASRYAVGHFLASTGQLDQIYTAMPAGESATLVLDTGNDSGRVELSMRMLPARPLAYPDGDPVAEGLFLLTLVDARYFWLGKFTGSGTAVVTDDTTTWNSVITAIATDLGITITADTAASADWGYAPNGLDLSGQPAAVVLDAILYACGLRFSQDNDGNYLARDADADALAVKNSLTSALRDIRASGGPFSLSRDDLPFDVTTVDDQPMALPEKVRLVVSAGGTTNEVNCNLFDQDSAFEIIRPGVAREWRTTRLVYGSVTSQTYVESLARSYGLRLLAAVSRRFAGIVNWGAEGVSEAIEWVYRLDESYTTIHPPPWHDGILELIGPDLAGSSCPPQTCPVGYDTPVDDCVLEIVGLECDIANDRFIQHTQQISLRNGKFHICPKTDYIPMPPCPVGPAGGALSPAYSADLTTTADSDPTAGKMRFDNATQNLATTLRLSNTDAEGSGWSAALASINNSTNAVKGQIRVFDTRDQSKFLTYDVTGLASPTGYKNIAVTNTGGSASSPFANGDALTVAFTPAGNHGYAGGGISISYTFDGVNTADADPTAGHLRLSSATQNTSTVIRADLLDAAGADWTAALAAIYASTNAVKANVRLFKTDDPSHFIVWQITSGAAPSGYRNLTGSVLGSSSANPFADGDNLTLAATPVGDVGASGGPGTGTVTSVDMTVPGFLLVTGNPITTSGTFAITLATQAANTVFAGPTTGGAAGPTFRALVKADQVATTGYTDSTQTWGRTQTFTPSTDVVAVSIDVPSGRTANTFVVIVNSNLKFSIDNTGLASSVGGFAGPGVGITTLDASNLTQGTVPAARFPAFTGDITTSAGGVATTLATVNANVGTFGAADKTLTVTANAKGLITAISQATIAITSSQVSGLAAIATSGSASDLSAGIVPAARFPAFTGDVTTSAGAVATTIGANKVTDGMLRQSAGVSVVGRSANTTGNVADITAAADDRLLARTTSALGFVQLTVGMFPANLVGNGQFRQGVARSVVGVTGNATANVADIQGTADQVLVVNGAGTALSFATVATGGLTNDAVTYAKMQNVSATSRVIGRKTAGAGDPEEITYSDVLDFVGSATLGDIFYRGASTWDRLAGNTTTTPKLLRQTGTGSASAAPTWDTISAVLDLLFGTTQGSVIYRGSSAWAALGPGTADQILCSGGAGANPSWKTLALSGTPTFSGTLNCAANTVSGPISGLSFTLT